MDTRFGMVMVLTRLICFVAVLLILLSPAVSRADRRDVRAHDPLLVQARLLTDHEYFDVLKEGMDKAKSEIVICAYLFKTLEGANGYPEKIVKSLSAAAGRGVRVFAVMELSQASGDLVRTNEETAGRLRQAGVKVCPDPKDRTTHTKLVVIDRRFLFIGSHNLTQSALKYNHEASLWIDSPPLAREALDYLDSVCDQRAR